jgi:hypothetical protein
LGAPADEERFKSEVDAARIVQQRAHPGRDSRHPGSRPRMRLQAAGQVSGDFFEILPAETVALLS